MMDILYKLLLWLHLTGLAMGGAAAFGHPVLGAIGARSPEARPHMMRASKALSGVGRAAIGILIVTGVIMVAQSYDLAALPITFWIKMVLVVALVANVITAGLAAKAMAAGNAALGSRLALQAKIGVALILLITLFAVLAFG
jgi:hypothetical protein